MSFHLKRRERLARGIRRIAAEQLDGVRRDLRRARLEESIHEVRKRTKRVRAVLRLVRTAIKPAIFDRENTSFRDIGHRFAALRDADVLVETVGKLQPETGRAVSFEHVLTRLRHHRQRVRREFFSDPEILKAMGDVVDEARSRIDDWTRRTISEAVLEKGLRRSYRRARDTFEAARLSSEDQRWHDWRKRTKDLYHHLQLIEPVWSPVIGAAAEKLKDLSHVLGEDHDLAIVRQQLADVVPEADVAVERRRIRALVDRRRRKLHAEARKAGQALLDEKPRAFAERFEACWDVWRR